MLLFNIEPLCRDYKNVVVISLLISCQTSVNFKVNLSFTHYFRIFKIDCCFE